MNTYLRRVLSCALFKVNHVLLFSFVVSVEPQVELFTLYPGDRLDLSCTAENSPQAVNWTKDHVAVVDGEHTHIRNGQLEIETVELADSGLYACTTFSNHSVYFNVTGNVVKKDQNRSEPSVFLILLFSICHSDDSYSFDWISITLGT